MLIDLLTAADAIINVDKNYHMALKYGFKKAVKFELAVDFATAAEGLAEDFRNVAAALPYCRLPFPLTWIEVAQANRPRFAAAPIHVPEVQSVPTRVGFLLNAGTDDQAVFSAFQFWEIKKHPGIVTASHMGCLFDPRRANDPWVETKIEHKFLKIQEGAQWKRADPTTRAIISNVVIPAVPAYVEGGLKSHLDSDSVQLMHELGAADWSGEATFVLATLALMNTLNATERTEVDVSKLNKRRLRKNEPPLNDHYVLKIHPRIRRSMTRKGMGTSHGDVRGHLVKGHWKVRKSGVWWWSPHARGDKTRMIDKRYLVD